MLSVVDWGKGHTDSQVVGEREKLYKLAAQISREAELKQKNAEFIRILSNSGNISVEIYASSSRWLTKVGEFEYWQPGIVLDEYSLIGINYTAILQDRRDGYNKPRRQEAVIPVPVLLETLGLEKTARSAQLLIEWLAARTRWGDGFLWTSVQHRRCFTGSQVFDEKDDDNTENAFKCYSCGEYFKSNQHPKVDLELRSFNNLPVVYDSQIIYVLS